MDSAVGAKCYRKIAISGVVQGVGFRPFVLRLACGLDILGTVRNKGGAVLISACGAAGDMKTFITSLKEQAPSGSRVMEISAVSAEPFSAEDFRIIESDDDTGIDNVFISPDLSVCGDCLRDLEDANGRRFRHPFNSCVDCGPRFSIIERLPYDRETTVMKEFSLCESCSEEYNSAGDRRCHAQTVCCNECGPVLKMRLRSGELCENEAVFAHAVKSLERGEIIAIKGVGGYHFACSPYSSEAVRDLRELKGRDKKPFAIMFRDMDAIRKICFVGEAEARLLTSPARPIVLLGVKESNINERGIRPDFYTALSYGHREAGESGVTLAEETLCGDIRCGCFLPYTALHALLIESLESLVLTSANPSGSAIFADDTEMLEFFASSQCSRFAGVLYHDRKILRAVEDSVAQVIDGQAELLRRSRGYAPAAVMLENSKGHEFLAMGGDLKASFCLVKNSYAYQSPYIGDLEEKSVYERYSAAIHDFSGLLNIKPSFVVCDSHPGYISSNLAKETGLPILKVQHHHAHIASVMAEHDLHEKVLGVAFDGTGYGDDGCIWGGEFLVCEGRDYRRAGHLDYTMLLGGDLSVKDAKKTAFCFLHDSGVDTSEADAWFGHKDTLVTPDNERIVSGFKLLRAALNANVNTVKSSSMGRLFDAVAAILDVAFENGYEGECAILLQRHAERALKSGAEPYPLRFDIKEADGCLLANSQNLIREMFYERTRISPGALALGFHFAVAELVKDICMRLCELESCDTVALSGGVFQNSLLLNLTRKRLINAGFKVYTNQMSVPNDGGISLGQAYIGGKSLCV